MSINRNIQNIGICGILTLDMHSLNNEGVEGNVLETRMVEIVDKNGQLYSVNAISGDMFKFIQYNHLVDLALKDNINLCEGCRNKNPNRINVDNDFGSNNMNKTNEEIIDELLEACAGDDIEGVMITSLGGSKKSIARKSIIEFGWLIGIPEQVTTENYFHVKFDKAKTAKGSAQANDESGQNIGQNIFHRPASSGRYAVVINLDLFRIGYNDLRNSNVLNEKDQKIRKNLVIQSVIDTFLKPIGAMRNTQLPHIINFEGIITTSVNRLPAPMISPLYNLGDKSYQEEINKIVEILNKQSDDNSKILTFTFEKMSEFAEKMSKLI